MDSDGGATYTDLGTLDVDGETFAVRRRDEDGSAHYDWISGPNPGYGFSTSGSGQESREHHATAIRGFLASIDPATGYL
jgi:hypothetical protein